MILETFIDIWTFRCMIIYWVNGSLNVHTILLNFTLVTNVSLALHFFLLFILLCIQYYAGWSFIWHFFYHNSSFAITKDKGAFFMSEKKRDSKDKFTV